MKINNNPTIGQGNTYTTGKNSLSIDDFLNIMAAEIKNQSPMGSGEGSGSKADYISQLAQFTGLEQMANISDSISLLSIMIQQQYSFSLIGKQVTVSDGNAAVSGIVDKVKLSNGYVMLQVNDKDYFLGSVMEVANNEVTR